MPGNILNHIIIEKIAGFTLVNPSLAPYPIRSQADPQLRHVNIMRYLYANISPAESFPYQSSTHCNNASLA